jgi:hypothetical protein
VKGAPEALLAASERVLSQDGDRRLVSLVEVGGPAEPEIDRHEHQSGAMRDRNGERPECQIASKYDPFSRPTVTPLTEPRPASRSAQ